MSWLSMLLGRCSGGSLEEGVPVLASLWQGAWEHFKFYVGSSDVDIHWQILALGGSPELCICHGTGAALASEAV